MRTIGTHRHAALIALIIDERRAAGLRQEDVAQKLDQTQQWIARLESGQRRLDVIEFLALAEAVGFDPVEAIKRVVKVRG